MGPMLEAPTATLGGLGVENMRADKNILRAALLASAALAGIVGAPGVAQAQATGEVDVGEIVVTGSRIRRPDLTSVQPLQIITTERMEERGFTNVADALNDLPSVGVPISPVWAIRDHSASAATS